MTIHRRQALTKLGWLTHCCLLPVGGQEPKGRSISPVEPMGTVEQHCCLLPVWGQIHCCLLPVGGQGWNAQGENTGHRKCTY